MVLNPENRASKDGLSLSRERAEFMKKQNPSKNSEPIKAAKDITTPEQEYAKLLKSLEKYFPNENFAEIEEAYLFASEKHRHQKRRSGEPYITHPLAVATIATSLKLDRPSIIAAILHDTVEDTDTTLEEVRTKFGNEVGHLVDGLTKINKIKFRSNREKLAENFRKMILAMTKDLRVILIKFCDRLHNMQTIGHMPEEKKKRISQETLDIYAPLANRLGIYNVKSELEDLCLRELKKECYQDIRHKISAKKSERENYIREVKQILEHELKKYGFKDIEVYGRPKHFFSIYKKMMDRYINFEDIHDLFAFRIIVSSIKDCYEALGVIHAMWKPMPGRFKDYIAMPKANMYQSLHTTVIRPNGEPAEIQIRTKEMHETCEFGVAAHWAYKSKSKNIGDTDLEKFSWLRQIMQWQTELKDPDEFLEAVKVDLFDEEIFVFTPKGDVFSLPHKATALDFAFAVHTEVGLKTIGAKVNGRIVPIKKQLNSGDIVEILTSLNQRPSKDWLSFITTSKARNKIRSHLRTEQRERSRKIGRDLINQSLENLGYSLEKITKSGEIEKIIKAAKESNLEDVIIAIGYGRIDANEIILKAFPQKETRSIEDQVESIETKQPKTSKSQSILVSGYNDVLVQIARCCNPLVGEAIIGFITRGKGVTIHMSGCQRALDLDPARRIEVEWEQSGVPKWSRCHLTVLTQDKPGVLAEVTSMISGCGSNVLNAKASISDDLSGVLDFELSVKNLDQLELVTTKLESIPAVIKVERRHTGHKKRTRKKGRHF